jgi:hypothetical protein
MITRLLTYVVFVLSAIVAEANVGYVTAVSPTYKLCAYLNDPEIACQAFGTIEWTRYYRQNNEWTSICEYLLVSHVTGEVKYYKFDRINTDIKPDMYLIPSLYKISISHTVNIEVKSSDRLWSSIVTLTEINYDAKVFTQHLYDGIVISSYGNQGYFFNDDCLDDRKFEFEEIKEAMKLKCTAHELEQIIKKYDYIKIPSPKIPSNH